jgi:hypothetical protein
VVYHAEGIAGGLTVADEVAVDRLLLRVKVIVQDLVETTQAHAGRLFFLIITNPGPTPDALDHEGVVVIFFIHISLLSIQPYLSRVTFSLKDLREDFSTRIQMTFSSSSVRRQNKTFLYSRS